MHNGRHKRRAKLKPQDATLGLDVVHSHAAGIDVGNDCHWVAVPPSFDENAVRSFGCFTKDLNAAAQWLQGLGIKTVAMQSTGVYGIALYEILEQHGMEVYLVNARDTKNLPGRKTDVQECQWILKLHVYGLLRNSFCPAENIRVMRSYWRQRQQHVSDAARNVQHMQKAMTQMNVQLANAISDISGTTGQAIIDAILDGERNPERLAELSDPRIKASRQTVAASLEGNWKQEQLFNLRQAQKTYRHFQKQIEECDQEIEKHFATIEAKADPETLPKVKRTKRPRGNAPQKLDLREQLYRITGVDLTAIDGINVVTAQTVIAEVGTEMSRFPTAGHFASWLGLCPNHRITGGKIIGRERKRPNRLAMMLRQGATTLLRSQSYLGAQYRRHRTKSGPMVASKAMAHRLARIIYHLMKDGQEYVDKGQEYYHEQHRSRQIRMLNKKAAELGMRVIAGE